MGGAIKVFRDVIKNTHFFLCFLDFFFWVERRKKIRYKLLKSGDKFNMIFFWLVE